MRLVRSSKTRLTSSLLGFVEQGFNGAGLVKAIADDVRARANERTLQGLVPHDGGIVFGVGPANHGLSEFGEVGRTAHDFEFSLIFQIGSDGDQIDGRVAAVELKEAGVERLMGGEVEIFGGKRVDERMKNAVADKNAPQYGLFGFHAVGGDSAEQIVRCPVRIGGGCHAEIPLVGSREKGEQRRRRVAAAPLRNGTAAGRNYSAASTAASSAGASAGASAASSSTRCALSSETTFTVREAITSACRRTRTG